MEIVTNRLTSDWTLPLGMLQGRPGPDSPFGDLLGYIIVFFVIVWPILRGIMASARGQREEFEEKQKKGGPPASAKKRPRRTLEEILEGKLERADVEVSERHLAKGQQSPPQAANRAATQAGTQAGTRTVTSAPPRFGERPQDESSAPIYRSNDLQGGDPSSEELVGDPFDEAAMERKLVPDAKLRHISSEDDVETGTRPIGTQARGETVSSVASRARPKALATALPEATLVREDPEVLFRRLKRPLSPWQKAVVLREVLRPPLATRPTPSLTDLPD